MWELPSAIVNEGEDPLDAALRAARAITGDADLSLSNDEPVAAVKHVFSHRIEQYHAYALEGVFALRNSSRRAWHVPRDRESRALPRAQQKLLKLISTSTD
jgi:adenine-specific DNA glycosylase